MKLFEKAILGILISTVIVAGVTFAPPFKPSVPFDSPYIKSVSVTPAEAGEYRPVSFEQITVTNTAGGLTTSKYYTAATDKVLADYAECVLETAQIRFNDYGTAPTSSVGTPLEVGQYVILRYDQMKGFSAIRTGATSGVLNVRYYKWYP